MAQARLLGVFLIAEDHERELRGTAQNLDMRDVDLDLAGGKARVDQAFVAGLHLAVDAHAPFRTQRLHLSESRAVGIGQNLRDPEMVTQVHEQYTAMVADAMHPARQAHGLADMRFGQLGTGMAAVCVHGVLSAPGGR